MTVFADSSALVKLYADEVGADEVRRVQAFVVSAAARVEVPAAFWRKSRMRELQVEDAAVLVQAFESDWNDPEGPFLPVALRPPVLDDAAGLVASRHLRAYDAVQLACARAARDVDPQIDVFLGFDQQLRDAATREGFATET
jgi:predicted nucleic acid-binding protein